MTISCGTCPNTWTGNAKAHCSGCHRTFSTVGAFDRHRLRYECQNPAERGLIQANGVWRYEESRPKDLAA